MAPMVRKQIYIEAEQNRRLKRIAEERGTSEAEIVRRGLDYFERVEVKRETVTPPLDLSAWEESKRFIAERMERYKDVPQTGRSWTRDELYDDDPRFARWRDAGERNAD
jgi:hypothetical protein